MAFKSNDRTFEKVYGTFDKRDYFNAQGLAKTKIGNFERALQKNDKGAQQILDKFKGDMGKAKDYITQVITDRKKEQAFNDYKAFKVAVDSIQKGKPQYGAVDLVKSRIHNSSQKYTIALYSALRNKKFTKWKDVHNDVDDLIGESVNEAMKPSQVRSAISKVKKGLMRKWKQKGGYENFGQKELSQMRDKFDYNPYGSSDERQIAKMLDGFDNWAMNYDGNMREAYVVTYAKKKGEKPASAAFSLRGSALSFERDLKKDGYITMVTQKKVKGVDESVNEYIEPQTKKIAYYTGTRPEAVKDFVSKHALNITKLLKYVEKGGLPQRMELVAALAGRPNNPKQKKIIKQFQESKGEVEQIAKKTKSETAFYDVLSKIEKKYGKRNYRIWLEKSLKDLGVNAKHYDYRTNAAAEEKLYQLTK